MAEAQEEIEALMGSGAKDGLVRALPFPCVISPGAQQRDILPQFLVEAVVLCLLGGLIGVTVRVGSSSMPPQLAFYSVIFLPRHAPLPD